MCAHGDFIVAVVTFTPLLNLLSEILSTIPLVYLTVATLLLRFFNHCHEGIVIKVRYGSKVHCGKLNVAYMRHELHNTANPTVRVEGIKSTVAFASEKYRM